MWASPEQERRFGDPRDRALEAPAHVGGRQPVAARSANRAAQPEDVVAARQADPARREVGDDRVVGGQHGVRAGARASGPHELAGEARQDRRRSGIRRAGLIEVQRQRRDEVDERPPGDRGDDRLGAPPAARTAGGERDRRERRDDRDAHGAAARRDPGHGSPV